MILNEPARLLCWSAKPVQHIALVLLSHQAKTYLEYPRACLDSYMDMYTAVDNNIMSVAVEIWRGSV